MEKASIPSSPILYFVRRRRKGEMMVVRPLPPFFLFQNFFSFPILSTSHPTFAPSTFSRSIVSWFFFRKTFELWSLLLKKPLSRDFSWFVDGLLLHHQLDLNIWRSCLRCVESRLRPTENKGSGTFLLPLTYLY